MEHYLFFLSCSSSSTASVLSLFAQILQVVPPNAAWPDALWEDDFWEKDFWEKDFWEDERVEARLDGHGNNQMC